MDGKSTSPFYFPINISSPPNQLKALLTTDGIIKLINSTDDGKIVVAEFREEAPSIHECRKPEKLLVKEFLAPTDLRPNLFSTDYGDEFKIRPREVFMATICQVCKVTLSRHYLCRGCKMISYCREDHCKADSTNHQAICMAIQLTAKHRGGHVYNMSKHLSRKEFATLKAHTIFLCEQFLGRSLLRFEREIFQFPRICHDETCREWKTNLLSDCKTCGQVSFCQLHPLSKHHTQFCSLYALYHRIVLKEKSYGSIEVSLPHRVLKKSSVITDSLENTLKLMYRNVTAFQDECVNAALMEVASFPLTALYALKLCQVPLAEQAVIHLVGAEIKVEASSLNKWEAFLLHLLPEVSELHIVFVGPELNSENWPIELISRQRMCRNCRQNCRGIRFDFQCKKFYHDYCASSFFTVPDIVIFFNPDFQRPGFVEFDTWPKTIEAAFCSAVPIVVTSSSETESFSDFSRVDKLSDGGVEIVIPPQANPYSTTRPERSSSSESDPIIFKNKFLFIVKDV